VSIQRFALSPPEGGALRLFWVASYSVSSYNQNIDFTPLTAGATLHAGHFSTGFSSRFGSLTFR